MKDAEPGNGLDRAAIAVYVTFAVNGSVFAAWTSRIPDIKQQLELTAGQLGTVMLVGALGAVVGLPLSGWLTGRLGAARAVLAGTSTVWAGLVLSAAGLEFADSAVIFAIGLFCYGLGMGSWDVAMNLEGAEVEHLLGRTIMPRFHAAFSGGTVAGALIGAACSKLEIAVGVHLAVWLLVAVAAVLWASRWFLPAEPEDDADDVDHGPAGAVAAAWRNPVVWGIGLITMVAGFTEGTANDWIAVAFVEGHDVPNWAGTLAFACFLTFMTVGRIGGTVLLDRFGRVTVLRAMFAAAAVGCLLVVFVPAPWAYLGAAIWGTGVALGFPVGMSAAADDRVNAAARVSVVATIAYTAFLAGPPLLGYLGDHVGVLNALLAVGIALVPAFFLLPVIRERR